RIQETIDSIQATRVTVEKRRARTLTLQSSVADVGASVDQALANVKKARDQALSRLMVRDSPPIWSAELRSQNGASLLSDSRESLAVQLRGVVAYMKRQPEKFIIHAAVFCFVTIAMF